MSLDNLLLVLSTFIAGSLMLIGGLVTAIYARKKNRHIVFLFSVNWLMQSIFWYFVGIAHLLGATGNEFSIIFMATAFIFQSIGILYVFIFIELIEKERINPLMISILIFIEISYIFSTFLPLIYPTLPNSMEIVLDYGVHIVGTCRIFQILLILFYGLYFFSWGYKTWKKAPIDLKQNATYLFLGSILMSIITVLLYALGTFLKTFNALGFIMHSIGSFITVLIIRKEPKIIHILPFKAYRLVVFETKGGIGLFSHDWAEIKELEKGFFAMMFQAVGNVLTEILDKGNVREIHLDEAILLVQHDKKYPIASVLVTSKSNKSLRQGLKRFHDQFISQFSAHLDAFHNINKFQDAQKIVERVFDFVPYYKHKDLRKLKITSPPK